MLSNAYFLAKFRFDTADNEPAKNLQNLANQLFSNFAKEPDPAAAAALAENAGAAALAEEVAAPDSSEQGPDSPPEDSSAPDSSVAAKE